MASNKRQTSIAPSVNGNTLNGRAIVFYDGTESTQFDLGDFIERVDPKCEVLFDPRTMATYGHKVDNLLGTMKAGTLKLEVNSRGVDYQVELPPTSTATEVKALIARGDLDGSSFQFFSSRPACQYTVTKENGRMVKTITKMTVLELGPVPQQSYMGTKAELRSLQDEYDQEVMNEKTKQRILDAKTKKRISAL